MLRKVHPPCYFLNEIGGWGPSHDESPFLNVFLSAAVQGVLNCILTSRSLTLVILLMATPSLMMIIIQAL